MTSPERWLRGVAVPLLAILGALLVAAAAVVLIVDTARADGDGDREEERAPSDQHLQRIETLLAGLGFEGVDLTDFESDLEPLLERLRDRFEDGLRERPPDRIDERPPTPADTPDGITRQELDAAVERALRQALADSDITDALVEQTVARTLEALEPALQDRLDAIAEALNEPADEPRDPPAGAGIDIGSADGARIFYGRIVELSDGLITLTGDLGPETVDISEATQVIGEPHLGGFATIVSVDEVARLIVAAN